MTYAKLSILFAEETLGWHRRVIAWKSFLALTQGERNALKTVASGKGGSVSIVQLSKLKSFDLVDHDGRAIVLTAHGRAVEALVDRTR